MGAWGTGIFENDATLDAVSAFPALIIKYYETLVNSEIDEEVVLGAYIFIASSNSTISSDDPENYNHIKDIVNCLPASSIREYKYDLLKNLYKAKDNVNDTWTSETANDRKKVIENLIFQVEKINVR